MQEKKFLQLNSIGAYKISFNLSNMIWEIVIAWDYLAKDTVGKQFIRAVDSISANVAEGFGRHGKKDKIKFYYYGLGSLKESFDWNEKSRVRKLINEKQYKLIFDELNKLPQEINYLIKFTRDKLRE